MEDNFKPKNFIELITNSNIRIPIIQRDYVQGNEEKKSNRKNKVKEKLLNDIFNVLNGTVSTMNLDFIYGMIKNEGGDFVFEPIDGQQRLTTLFLLTCFIAKKGMLKNEISEYEIEEIKKFKDFTYAVRSSSKEFCEAFSKIAFELPNQDSHMNLDIPNNNVKEFIMNQNWFYEEWEKDGTIMSMLEMLDSIGKKYDEAIKNGKNILFFRIKNIEFKFIKTNQKSVNLNDDTYIKLNARGIKLSSFEKYKTEFLKNLKNDKDEYTKLSENIEKDWTEWLWRKINKKEYEKNNNIFDNAFTQIFRAIFTIENILYKPIEKKNEKEYENIQKLERDFFLNKNEFENNKKVIKNVQNFLNFIIENKIEELKEYINFNRIIDKLIENGNEKTENKNKNEIEFPDLWEFYIIYLYGAHYGKNSTFDYESFIQWVRIARNLLPRLCNTRKEFSDYIKNIEKIFEKINSGSEYLFEFEKILDNFYLIDENNYDENLKNRIISEKKKIQVMKLESRFNWKEKIEYVDKNQKLCGDTEFLLEFCGIEDIIEKQNLQYEDECFEKYEKLVKLFDVIFSNGEIINEKLENESILARAMLTYTDNNEKNIIDKTYLLNVGAYHSTFLTNNQSRDCSLRNIFSDEKRKFVKMLMCELIDKNSFDNEEKVLQGLKEIINNYNENKEIKKDWRRYFIENNGAFYLLEPSYNLLRVENKKDLLLKKKRAPNSLCLPLIFYAIHRKINYGYKIKEDCDSVFNLKGWVISPRNSDDMKITEINGKKVLIQIKYDAYDRKFHYYRDINNLEEEKMEVQKILEEIESEFDIKFEIKNNFCKGFIK